MTALIALQNAAVRLIGRRPITFFASPEVFELEMSELASEVGADIAASADWQSLTRLAVILGDDVTAGFDLPDDYDRMPIDTKFLDRQMSAWGYARSTDLNAFLAARAGGMAAAPGLWTILADQIQFAPAPPAGAEIQFPYIDRNFCTDTNNITKPAFTADSDEFRLSERLLTLGLVFKWRQNKRLDHGEDLANFEKAMNEAMGRDKGSRIFVTGPSRWPGGNVSASYPWPLGQ